jgi:hypothetical protein
VVVAATTGRVDQRRAARGAGHDPRGQQAEQQRDDPAGRAARRGEHPVELGEPGGEQPERLQDAEHARGHDGGRRTAAVGQDRCGGSADGRRREGVADVEDAGRHGELLGRRGLSPIASAFPTWR